MCAHACAHTQAHMLHAHAPAGEPMHMTKAAEGRNERQDDPMALAMRVRMRVCAPGCARVGVVGAGGGVARSRRAR